MKSLLIGLLILLCCSENAPSQNYGNALFDSLGSVKNKHHHALVFFNQADCSSCILQINSFIEQCSPKINKHLFIRASRKIEIGPVVKAYNDKFNCYWDDLWSKIFGLKYHPGVIILDAEGNLLANVGYGKPDFVASIKKALLKKNKNKE